MSIEIINAWAQFVAALGVIGSIDESTSLSTSLLRFGKQRQKFALLLVVHFDAAGEDVVVPAVDVEVAVGCGVGDGGLGAQVCELGDDVAADQRVTVEEGKGIVTQPAGRPGRPSRSPAAKPSR